MKAEIFNVDAWAHIATLPDKSVDAIITDPLYDATLNMNELRRICKGHIIAFCKPLHPFFPPDKLDYWVKATSTKNTRKRTSEFVEWITFEFHGDTFNADLHWSNYTGVYDDRLLTKQIHPYEKPISLMERLIAIYTKPGDLVFDPFCGSGSTLRACRNLGRRAMGCEIDPAHFVRLSELP